MFTFTFRNNEGDNNKEGFYNNRFYTESLGYVSHCIMYFSLMLVVQQKYWHYLAISKMNKIVWICEEVNKEKKIY